MKCSSEKKKKLNLRHFVFLLKLGTPYERCPVFLQRTTSYSEKPALDPGLQV